MLQRKTPLRTGDKVAKIQVLIFLLEGLGVVLYLPNQANGKCIVMSVLFVPASLESSQAAVTSR